MAVYIFKENKIQEIPFDLYVKDFKFEVNGETYETNRLIADLLSSQICSFHYSDPTINEYHLNTIHRGDFQQILNLIKYEEYPIYIKDLPFYNEILQLLNNKWIEVESKTSNKEESLTIDKAIELLSEHSKYVVFYSYQVNEDIEFISSHFYEMKMSHIKKITEIDQFIIESIINNEKLQLESEDQLIQFINELYLNDKKFSTLYKYVKFCNLSQKRVRDFLNTFKYTDLTYELWETISKRLEEELSKKQEQNKRYHSSLPNMNSKSNKEEKVSVLFNGNNEFKGIFHYFKTYGNIENEISITNSALQYSENENSAKYVLIFDDANKYFRTKSVSNAFICFEFKKVVYAKGCPRWQGAPGSPP